MNILAIDYGTKRIGLAWMQEGLDVVLPFGQIISLKSKVISPELVDLIRTERINKIIVGLPITLEDGSENPNTERVRAFGKALQEATGVEVVFEDERLSSAEADEMGGEASRDEKAAMVILRQYQEKLKK